MSPSIKLGIGETDEKIDKKMHRGMIGCLLYLTPSRPDIILSVGICARYQSCLKVSHLNAVTRTLKYFKALLN